MEDILKMQDLCSRGDLEAVKVFAETAEKDDLAVHQAVMKGHLEIVQFLFEKWDGLDVNRHFQWACYSGQLQVAQSLLEKGTNVNDTAGKYTALEGACIGGYIEIIKFLLKNGALITDNRAFQAACKYGHFEIVKFLFDKGADIHSDDESPLFHACLGGYIEIIRFLFENGAFIAHKRMFQAACKYGRIELVKFLFEQGADIHSDGESYMPLKWASQFGHLEVVKFLFEKGVDIHADNELSLRWASAKGHLEIVKFLLEKGAVIDSAIEFACFGCHLELVKFLVEKGANVNFGLRNARFTKHFEIARFLIQKGADRSLLTRKTMRYVSFCEKVENRRRIAAANKIGSWWIPICYDLNRECGKRMMERSWTRVEAMYAERN